MQDGSFANCAGVRYLSFAVCACVLPFIRRGTGCVQADPMTKFRLEDATHQGLFLEDIKTLIKELQRWLDFTSVLA